MMEEQQADLPVNLFLIQIKGSLDNLLEGAVLNVGVVLIIMVNYQNHGQIVVAPAET